MDNRAQKISLTFILFNIIAGLSLGLIALKMINSDWFTLMMQTLESSFIKYDDFCNQTERGLCDSNNFIVSWLSF